MHVHVSEMQPLDLPALFPDAKCPCLGFLRIAAGARLGDRSFLAPNPVLYFVRSAAALTTQNTKAGVVGC